MVNALAGRASSADAGRSPPGGAAVTRIVFSEYLGGRVFEIEDLDANSLATVGDTALAGPGGRPDPDVDRVAARGSRLRARPCDPPRVRLLAITKMAVELSWDRGATWTRAALRGCTATGCTAQVQNVRNTSASLRVTATDALGRSVRQTVVDAYLVR
jgi:hypothetical protein